MPENNDDDLPPRAQPAGPPGETVDLSNPDAEGKSEYSDVPVRPEVQEAIDQYYEQKEQESDEEQEEVDERTPDEFNIDQRDNESVESGTGVQNEDADPFAEAKSVTHPSPPPEPESETEDTEPETDPEPDPRQEAQAATAEEQPHTADATDDTEDGTSDLSLEGQELGEEVDLSEVDLDSIENQQWGLGKTKPAKMVTMKGMKFLLTEPDDDDAVVNSISKVRRGDLMAAFKALSQLTVEAPTISDERWEQDMTAMERFSLGNIVLQYLDAQDF